MRHLIFILLVVFATLPLASAQSTSERNFRARSNASGSLNDCTLRARSNESATTDRRFFRARPRNHDLVISAVNGVAPALTNAIVDTTFAAGSTLLQAAQNPPADVACCVSITRNGTLGNFAQPTGMVGGVITTNAELTAVAGIGADIMVVNGISFCAGAGNFTGCRTGGSIILTRARISAANAATTAHELGHREGLCHTTGCPCGTCGTAAACTCAGGSAANIRTVMFCAACAGRDTISAAECSTYQSNATQ